MIFFGDGGLEIFVGVGVGELVLGFWGVVVGRVGVWCDGW